MGWGKRDDGTSQRVTAALGQQRRERERREREDRERRERLERVNRNRADKNAKRR
jgi:hypothetical protein